MRGGTELHTSAAAAGERHGARSTRNGNTDGAAPIQEPAQRLQQQLPCAASDGDPPHLWSGAAHSLFEVRMPAASFGCSLRWRASWCVRPIAPSLLASPLPTLAPHRSVHTALTRNNVSSSSTRGRLAAATAEWNGQRSACR